MSRCDYNFSISSSHPRHRECFKITWHFVDPELDHFRVRVTLLQTESIDENNKMILRIEEGGMSLFSIVLLMKLSLRMSYLPTTMNKSNEKKKRFNSK